MSIPDVIQLLPDSIANQIAAGEVVQRPASAVKELMENAVDAGARSVSVLIRDAGKQLIQVVDDGKGMSETDARLSFERHATSKLRISDDLFRIKTMGFRGEALASIAAVAQVELRTRRPDDETGTMIRIEGSEVKEQTIVSAPTGTNVQVKNLFFNVPARRNFLKSNPVEMRHILDEFQRVALAHPDISFVLSGNDQEMLNLPAGKLARRIVDVFGKNYREQLTPVDEETSYVSIHGYIGKPEFAKKTRGEQFFFVNNRFIKHSYLHHALITAFEGTLQEGSHPFYVLFIEIDPSHIDVNIHPTKTEVKFDDERSVYGIIMAAVRRAIGMYNLTSSIDFEDNVNFLKSPENPSGILSGSARPIQPTWATRPSEPGVTRKKGTFEDWVKLFEGDSKALTAESRLDNPLENPSGAESIVPGKQAITFSSRVNRMQTEATPTPDSDAVLTQLHHQFLISQGKDGVILIDQKAAHERILYERYRLLLAKRNGASQQLMFPRTVRMSPSDMHLVRETSEEIRSLGFDFDAIGPHELVVRGVPADLPDENEQEMFEELVEQLKLSVSDLKLNRPESLARSLARKFASRYMGRLSELEMRTLIDQLFATSDPNRTPAGEPIIVVLSKEKLFKLFRS